MLVAGSWPVFLISNVVVNHPGPRTDMAEAGLILIILIHGIDCGGKQELSLRNIGLCIHYAGLSQINKDLRRTDPDQGESEKNLNPMRHAQVVEWRRSIPISAGWFAGWIGIWLFCAKKGHDRQSILWSSGAIVCLMLAVVGLFFMLLWQNSIFSSENASASFGSACISAPPYGRRLKEHLRRGLPSL